MLHSALLGNIKDTNDTIATTDGKHLTTVAEVSRETSSRQIVNAIAGLKETVTVEYLDFVGAGATSNDQVV